MEGKLSSAVGWTGRQIAGTALLGFLCAPLILLFFVIAWARTYQESSDASNIGYVFWKHELNPGYNPQDALAALDDDDDPLSALGLPFPRLTQLVGYVVPLQQAPAYLQGCAHSLAQDATGPSQPPDSGLRRSLPFTGGGGQVYELRNSRWIVRVQDSKVVSAFFCNEN